MISIIAAFAIEVNVITAINNVEKLRVIDRASSFQFRNKEDAIEEIGEKLNVDAVLEGSVQKSGNRMRIMAQLIRVSDHSHYFSNTYNIEFRDIFAIQDTISLAVLRELKFTLMGYRRSPGTARSAAKDVPAPTTTMMRNAASA